MKCWNLMLIASRNSCLCNLCSKNKKVKASPRASFVASKRSSTFIKTFGQFEIIKFQPEWLKDVLFFLAMHQLPGWAKQSKIVKTQNQRQTTQLQYQKPLSGLFLLCVCQRLLYFAGSKRVWRFKTSLSLKLGQARAWVQSFPSSVALLFILICAPK